MDNLAQDIEAEPPKLPAAADLAAAIAARLCHDFISPAGAVASGVDLLEDPSAADMHGDAINLIGDSSKKLGALLEFYRVAFGASASAESFDVNALRSLTTAIFAYQRSELDWSVPFETLEKPAARALLNLAQLGGMTLPRGGTVRLSAEADETGLSLVMSGSGPKINFKPEVAEGLSGKPMTEGLLGYWVQAYYLASFITDAGGSISFEATDETVSISVRIPR